jgi:hypothetical protein
MEVIDRHPKNAAADRRSAASKVCSPAYGSGSLVPNFAEGDRGCR